MAGSGGLPEAVGFEVDGVMFELRLHEDPSGLRGQVFYGEDVIAGVQIYHHKDIDRLVAQARANTAVRRAVERLRPTQ